MTALSLIPEDDLVFDLKEKRLSYKSRFKFKVYTIFVFPIFFGILMLPFNPLSALFLFGGTILFYFGLTSLINQKLKKLNRCTVPPHEEIDSFLKWKEGDQIETEHFKDREFRGVTDDHKVILDSVYVNHDPVVLTTDYLRDHLKANASLSDRLEKKAREEIIYTAKEENRYDKFLENARKEYSKMVE